MHSFEHQEQRERAVMEILRRGQLSEAQVAELLKLDRWELLEVMGRYRAPAIRMKPEDMKMELAQEVQHERRQGT